MRNDAAIRHDVSAQHSEAVQQDTATHTKPTANPASVDLLAARYRDETCRVTLTGVQALARLPLDRARIDRAAGRHTGAFISGYQGSPLGGLDLELAKQQRLLDEHGVRFAPGLNEELAATAVQGSQLIRELRPTVDGVVGYWYGKAPGLDRASDALRHANLMGTDPNGGAVAFVGDDPAAKSSTVPCASELELADLMMPIFYPCDAADVLELGRHAVACSRASGLWSAMKIVTSVADGACTVDLNAGERLDPVLPQGAGVHVPTSKLLPPHLAPLERDQATTRLRIAREYGARNGLNRVVRRSASDRIGILAAGTDYLDTLQALATLGFGANSSDAVNGGRSNEGRDGKGFGEDDATELRGNGGQNAATVRVMKLGLIWPLDPEQLREFACGLDTIIVVEEKRAFIETQLREALYDSEHRPTILGKYDATGKELIPAYGELVADTVTRALAAALEGRDGMPGVGGWLEARRKSPLAYSRSLLPLAARTPYFCSGCPHNSSTKPRTDSAFGAGIGCHAMVLLMDPKQVGDVVGVTQMGGEGTNWIGMAPFVDTPHFVQNLGDGTFHHSGSLAIRASVAAGTNITYRLLYNSTVAMTGGQDAVGQMDVPSIARAMLAEGVARVIVTSDEPRALKRMRMPRGVEVWHRDRLGEAQEALAAVPGTTLLIHAQECATELRRKRKRGLAPKSEEFVMINERICEGCGDCGEKSNCLSVQPVETEFGRKTRIHQSSCNVDKSCLGGNCPAFVTVRPGKGTKGGGATPGAPGAPGLRGPASVPILAAESLPAPAARTETSARTQRIRLMGVGGTGVVTTSQLLATAAVLAGRYTRTLDRTGLAQKGGAVVSDITVARAPFDEGGTIPNGACGLYLGYDLLVAADAANLSVLAPDAAAIVSTSAAPTGAMVSDRRVTFPEIPATLGRVAECLPEGDLIDLDLRAYAEGFFGAEQFGNMFLLGIALQRGDLDLPPEAIEQAIELNGVAVGANSQAFRRGRQFVADRDALDACLREARGAAIASDDTERQPWGSELERLVAIRRAELVAYQHERYARRYEDFVERVRAREAEVTGGQSTRLAESVARSLYQLMAYKDEYEVARLALDPAMGEAVAAQFGANAAITWKLHPPLLKALGMRRKISLGAWFRPGFVALKALRRLRGTPFDPFGRDEVRRVERELLAEYERTIASLLPLLDGMSEDTGVCEDVATRADTAGMLGLDLAVEIAELPHLVRGYDEVKLRGVAEYRARRADLLARVGAP